MFILQFLISWWEIRFKSPEELVLNPSNNRTRIRIAIFQSFILGNGFSVVWFLSIDQMYLCNLSIINSSSLFLTPTVRHFLTFSTTYLICGTRNPEPPIAHKWPSNPVAKPSQKHMQYESLSRSLYILLYIHLSFMVYGIWGVFLCLGVA